MFIWIKGFKNEIENRLLFNGKKLTKYVHKVDIQLSIAPDHKLVCLSIQLKKLSTRGPGLWKFNNSLLKDEDYIERIQKSYPEIRSKYSYIQDEQMLWELLKMEIRIFTNSFAKVKKQNLIGSANVFLRIN